MKNKSAITYTQTTKFRIVLSISSGLFAFLFLLFFQPFGINNYRPDEKITPLLIILLLIFSILATLTILFLEFVIYPKFFYRKLAKKYIVWIILELWITASVTFMFYNIVGEFHDFYFTSYLKHIFEISSIFVIAFAGTHFYFRYNQVVMEYENVLSVSMDQSKLNEVVMLSGDYKNDEIALTYKNILFIRSEDNYASLNYLEGQTLKKYLIRSTLTNLEKKLGSVSIVRINRSLLVNLIHLESYKNASGKLKLKLNNTSELFDVSKSYQPNVVQLLRKYTH